MPVRTRYHKSRNKGKSRSEQQGFVEHLPQGDLSGPDIPNPGQKMPNPGTLALPKPRVRRGPPPKPRKEWEA